MVKGELSMIGRAPNASFPLPLSPFPLHPSSLILHPYQSWFAEALACLPVVETDAEGGGGRGRIKGVFLGDDVASFEGGGVEVEDVGLGDDVAVSVEGVDEDAEVGGARLQDLPCGSYGGEGGGYRLQ